VFDWGGDILMREEGGKYSHIHGRTRVSCGMSLEVCGVRVPCNCPQAPGPKLPR